MKVLVTGAAGFVGTAVVEALVDAKHSVRGLVRSRPRAAKAAALGAELVEGDLTDPASLRIAAQGVDAVVHLAAIRQGRPEAFERVMIEGTRHLLRAAQEGGAARWVQMSALGVTESTKDVVPYYGAKWQQEQDVGASEFDHVIFRPSFVFGPGGGILSTFRRIAKLAPVTPIPGSGQQRIQPIWIGDVAAYFAAALEQPEATNRLFEIGGPDAVTWNEFWERLKRTLGIRRPSVHVPMSLMRANAFVTERLPGELPLTRDLLTMLELGDNVVTEDGAVATFALPLLPLDDQLRRAV